MQKFQTYSSVGWQLRTLRFFFFYITSIRRTDFFFSLFGNGQYELFTRIRLTV